MSPLNKLILRMACVCFRCSTCKAVPKSGEWNPHQEPTMLRCFSPRPVVYCVARAGAFLSSVALSPCTGPCVAGTGAGADVVADGSL